MEVREARTADAPGIALVWQAAFAEKVKPMTILNRVGREGYIVLVSLVREQVTGFVIAYCVPEKGKASIEYVATHPIDAPRGTGTDLMERVHGMLSAQGITRVSLAVRRKNTRAKHVYEKLGYTVTAERPAGFTMEVTL